MQHHLKATWPVQTVDAQDNRVPDKEGSTSAKQSFYSMWGTGNLDCGPRICITTHYQIIIY